MTKPTPTETAQKIVETAERLGYSIRVSARVMTIEKSFAPNDNDAFVECDMTYYEVLSLLPRTEAGSDWGTDGGGIGGAVAIKNGRFTMNRSGGSKRVLAALAKVLAKKEVA